MLGCQHALSELTSPSTTPLCKWDKASLEFAGRLAAGCWPPTSSQIGSRSALIKCSRVVVHCTACAYTSQRCVGVDRHPGFLQVPKTYCPFFGGGGNTMIWKMYKFRTLSKLKIKQLVHFKRSKQ